MQADIQHLIGAPEAPLSTEGAARRLGLSRSYLEKLRADDGGPRYLKIGRAVRYRPADLDAWADRHAKGGAR